MSRKKYGISELQFYSSVLPHSPGRYVDPECAGGGRGGGPNRAKFPSWQERERERLSSAAAAAELVVGATEIAAAEQEEEEGGEEGVGGGDDEAIVLMELN